MFQGLERKLWKNGAPKRGLSMSLYLTFPVAMFWIANQAEWFEDHVIQRKRELWPPEKEGQRQELEAFKERIRKQREEKLLGAARQNP
ncbi:protein PET100 homolog, mitochondrial isoform X1 [Echinops telfairi]|uniref:Protein PET100 homolog, mitochondrial isoform X1 n=1 Tax=Echinops telfairi TaxID=9371 RepID=A0AC55D3H0_ECHTE|nr:protein PET100 homolog, mitochondrial isoform X1 [Echinops telfairi]